jgi:hypothetical protein
MLRVSPEENREWEGMPKKTLNSVHFHGPEKNIPSHSFRCVDHGSRSARSFAIFSLQFLQSLEA